MVLSSATVELLAIIIIMFSAMTSPEEIAIKDKHIFYDNVRDSMLVARVSDVFLI